jgi:hypothetical protein
MKSEGEKVPERMLCPARNCWGRQAMSDWGEEWQVDVDGSEEWNTHRPVNRLKYPEILGEMTVRARGILLENLSVGRD